jgi:hypothetical protein
MARLEITTPDGRRVYEILDEFVTIGREVGNHLRLNDPSVAPVHLRLIHGQAGYRLELADADLAVEVNGERCGARALQPGDEIRIGGTMLTFVDETPGAAPPVPPIPSRIADRHDSTAQSATQEPEELEVLEEVEEVVEPRPAPVRQPRPRSAPHAPQSARYGPPPACHAPHARHAFVPDKKKMPAWLTWVLVGALAFVLVLVVMRLLGAGSYYREEASPEHWLALAASQFDRREFSRALDSCSLADTRNPGAETRQRIQELRERIKVRMLRDADQGTLDLAQRALESMQQFEIKYLAASQPRPAARELARAAEQWLQRYAAVVRRYTDTAPDVPKVQALYDRYAPQAQLEQPDDSADVLFAVERRLGVPRPNYRDALTFIDGFMAAHPNDRRFGELERARATIVSTARAEFDRHAAEAKNLIAARRFDEARAEVKAMRDAIAVDSWAAQANAVEQDIERAAK